MLIMFQIVLTMVIILTMLIKRRQRIPVSVRLLPAAWPFCPKAEHTANTEP